MTRNIIKSANYIGPDRRTGDRRGDDAAAARVEPAGQERRNGKQRRARCAALDLNWKCY